MSEQQQDTQTTDAAQQAKKFEDLTPYAASEIVSAALRKHGLKTMKQGVEVDAYVSSQAMYSRASKNVIASYRLKDGKVVEDRSEGTWFFVGEAFAKWMKAYVNAQLNKGTVSKQNWDELADQYAI